MNPFDESFELLTLWDNLVDSPEIEMYRKLRRRIGGVATELGIGSGRVAMCVEPDNGVDSSPVMLQHCRELMGDKTPLLINYDFKDYRLDTKSTFTYCPLNSVNHLSPDHFVSAMKNVFENTEPDGYFVFDSIVPDLAKIKSRNNLTLFRGKTDEYAIYEVASVDSYEEQKTLVHGVVEFLSPQGEVRSKKHYPPIAWYYLFPSQILDLIKETHWSIENLWGTFDGEPLTEASKRQVWILRKS
ncbi:class I SAM-dependent methyltransferase [Alicyclobacillus sp. SO9]|uniref:class I SAM-dependent methyltransferase n=1 Tax=Alicyclobacillus sp. SO9 TaxID=2665646 RepID=UPI0018E9066B|nr:class I SAM-dependent methyltransferase [Alicyclobacillus sp. SO9]QQE79729.1 hypothetical protein GI364_04365 [Alicyclobacillus sp. SO9]